MRHTFIAVSAASGTALAVACGSFSEGKPTADDAGSVDAGAADVDGSASAATPRCAGTTRVREPFDEAFNFAGWAVSPGATDFHFTSDP